MKITFTILTLCISYFSFSQERYRILYDYKSDKISYLKIDPNYNIIDTLSQPKIKRNSIVELKLININPFAIHVDTDIKEEEFTTKGKELNINSLLGSINVLSDSDLGLNLANLPPSDLFSGSESRGAKLSNEFSDYNVTTSNIMALQTTLMSNLVNPNLSKEDILQNIINTAFLQEDASLSSPEDNFYVFITQLEKKIQEEKTILLSEIKAISKEVAKGIDTNEALSKEELIDRNYAISDLQTLLKTFEESSVRTIDNLKTIKSLYATLEASNFDRTYDYILESDKVNIQLKFSPSDFTSSSTNKNPITPLKTRNIQLYSKGGFKINTGVALTMNNFGNKSLDFYITEDGIIGADTNNYYTPNLSTMINFYVYSSKNIKVGGTFGLSIPISGDNNIKGVNYLFGPSIYFGGTNSLSISGGIAYGPIKRLTNGLKVGQTTSFRSVDNFTKTVYDFGYFFGISFSLFDIN